MSYTDDELKIGVDVEEDEEDEDLLDEELDSALDDDLLDDEDLVVGEEFAGLDGSEY
jgi:hypothetical protein